MQIDSVMRPRSSSRGAIQVPQLQLQYTVTDDRQRLEAVIRGCIRSGLCPADQSTVSELIDSWSRRCYTTATITYCINCSLSDIAIVRTPPPRQGTPSERHRTWARIYYPHVFFQRLVPITSVLYVYSYFLVCYSDLL